MLGHCFTRISHFAHEQLDMFFSPNLFSSKTNGVNNLFQFLITPLSCLPRKLYITIFLLLFTSFQLTRPLRFRDLIWTSWFCRVDEWKQIQWSFTRAPFVGRISDLKRVPTYLWRRYDSIAKKNVWFILWTYHCKNQTLDFMLQKILTISTHNLKLTIICWVK